MFKIESYEVLPSQVGKGLTVGDVVIGCGRITSIELPAKNTNLKQIAEADGLSLGYKPIAPSALTPNAQFSIEYNTFDLANANNYVLFISKDDKIELVKNTSQITEMFDLTGEDAELLDKYIGNLANTRNLSMLKTTDLDGEEFMFFVNKIDETMMDYYFSNNREASIQTYAGMMRSPELMAEIESHNFIKMFLIGLVKACQDRYNTIHRDKVLCKLAKELCEIRYWDDGVLLSPSIKDIEDFMNEMKNQILVR